MSVIRLAITAATVAVSVARNPVVRAGLRAALQVITPQMRAAAREKTLDAAYTAGTLVRRIVPGRRID